MVRGSIACAIEHLTMRDVDTPATANRAIVA
jgi:hypothetical protein